MKVYRGMLICPRCNGMGQVTDDKAVGEEMRAQRKARKVSLREIAKRLKWSAAYVSDLELGRRTWTNDKCVKYGKALNAL